MKPTILLIHGALNNSEQFTSLSEKLERYFDVHTLDFRGHSQAPYDGKLEKVDMGILVNEMVKFCG